MFDIRIIGDVTGVVAECSAFLSASSKLVVLLLRDAILPTFSSNDLKAFVFFTSPNLRATEPSVPITEA
ncbi:hypothetical protein DERF_001487 [Dermatophagoides farinae]|uniref:Uncharacterized protein n=1 Tax=Dermatophagoides farinae TaxID=6954 RepID=A0A922IF36_DERFA|nr:hypothetical protein DERF_001487 [Dermatophagoides farinae]